MNFNNYTIKSQEAIQKATEVAGSNQQQAIETGHILKGIQLTDDNVVNFVAKKIGVNQNLLNSRVDAIVQAYPKVSGGSPYLSNDAAAALQKATGYLKEFND